ncbi:hypothetical protein CHS0354_029517 [Potamilus streckersoni]|uniref:RING-type domain-containing protein n=1 Tax=Potamilus streckersoni TaxID=2493646 RepID=A0AAE0T1N5_9BIVA|nr:hypothetical protein CHS0354_029517 [Potamilus streckersoni]
MATESLLQSKRFTQILQCPMCLETLKTPRALPCGHTYCTLCLQSHINTKITSKERRNANFPCLLCGTNTTPFDHTVETGQWAETFPENCMVASLLDVNIGMRGRKGCDFCMKKRKEVFATSYCQDCHISMCDTCKQYHDDISVCDQKNSFSLNQRSELDNVRTCYKLRIMLQTTDVQIKSKEVETNLNKCSKCLKQITNCVRMSSDALQNDRAVISKKISSFIENLNVTLMKFERDLMVKLTDTHQSETLTLQYQEKEGKNLITSIHSDLMQLDLVMTRGSEIQKVITLHNLGQRQLKYFQATPGYLSSVNVIRLTLDIDRNLLDMLDTVVKFGQVLVTRSKFHLLPCENELLIQKDPSLVTETKLKCVSQFETKKIMQSEPGSGSGRAEITLKNKNFVKITEFNAKSARDKTLCQISDILQLQGSRLLIVDNKHQKVKILGPDYKCLNCMTFADCPWNACFISGIDVALTMPYQKTIQVIRIKDKMHTVREMKTKFQCWGIDTIRDHLVVTTWGDEHCLLILDWNGTEIRKIMPKDYQRNQLSFPSSVTTNWSQTVIYVTCHGGHTLVAYKTNWDILFTYTNQSKENVGGVGTDREGNIYLCDSNSSNIQKISTDGKFIRTLLSGKQKPLKIRFFKDTDRFLLTYHNCNVIEMYDIK